METIKQIKTVVDRWDGTRWIEVVLYRNPSTGFYAEIPELCEGRELLECRIDAAIGVISTLECGACDYVYRCSVCADSVGKKNKGRNQLVTRKWLLIISLATFAFTALYGRFEGFNYTPIVAAERAAK